jgi:hypothetical protein
VSAGRTGSGIVRLSDLEAIEHRRALATEGARNGWWCDGTAQVAFELAKEPEFTGSTDERWFNVLRAIDVRLRREIMHAVKQATA